MYRKVALTIPQWQFIIGVCPCILGIIKTYVLKTISGCRRRCQALCTKFIRVQYILFSDIFTRRNYLYQLLTACITSWSVGCSIELVFGGIKISSIFFKFLTCGCAGQLSIWKFLVHRPIREDHWWEYPKSSKPSGSLCNLLCILLVSNDIPTYNKIINWR